MAPLQRVPRWLRRSLALACGLLGLLTVDALGWPLLAPWLLGHLEPTQRLQWHPDTRVRLLVAPRLRTPQLLVPAADDGDAPRLLATDLELRWRWRDLHAWMQGDAPLQLRALRARQLQARWQRGPDGRHNWDDLLPPDARSTPPAQPHRVPIERLAIDDARLALDDAPLALRAQLRLSRVGAWRWQASASGQWRDQPLQLQLLTADPLPLLLPVDSDALPRPLLAELRHGDTRLRFQGVSASLWQPVALRGEIQLQGASLQASGRSLGLSLPHTPAYRLVGFLSHADGHWQLREAQASIGKSRLRGQLSVQRVDGRPLLRGQLHGGPLRLADLGPSIGADERPLRPGRVLPDRPFDLAALHAMDAEVQFKLSTLDLGSRQLKPLTPLHATLSLQRGLLRLSELQAGVADGALRGDITLNGRVDPPAWRAALQLDAVPLQRWWRRDPAPLQGELTGELQLHGRGAQVAELLSGADGELDLRLRHGRVSHLWTELAGLDLGEALGVWARGDRPLPLRCARLRAQLQRGVLRPQYAVLDNADSRLMLDGSLSFVQERLALRAVAQPHDASPFSLRSPLRLEGSFARPRLTLDGAPVGRKLLAAAALSSLAAPAGLLAFVDPGDAPAGRPCAELEAPAAG